LNAKRLSLLVDLALLAASFRNGPVAEQIRLIGMVAAAALGVAAVFCGIVLCVAVLQQRQPPYPL
jgi:hypothetical protein